MKSLTFHTCGCIRAGLWDCSSSSLLEEQIHKLQLFEILVVENQRTHCWQFNSETKSPSIGRRFSEEGRSDRWLSKVLNPLVHPTTSVLYPTLDFRSIQYSNPAVIICANFIPLAGVSRFMLWSTPCAALNWALGVLIHCISTHDAFVFESFTRIRDKVTCATEPTWNWSEYC